VSIIPRSITSLLMGKLSVFCTIFTPAVATRTNDLSYNCLSAIFVFRPKKFTLKGYKRYWFTYKDLHLYLYKSREESRSSVLPSVTINLRGCEVTPEVNLAQGKFHIKLEVPPEFGNAANNEVWIRCDHVSLDQEPKGNRTISNIHSLS
jgi:hypothetical protein